MDLHVEAFDYFFIKLHLLQLFLVQSLPVQCLSSAFWVFIFVP